jgi:outer membrane protein
MGNPTRTWFNRMLAVLIAAALAPAATAVAQDFKIGYINALRIEKESASARRAAEALRKEFEPRNQQVTETQKRVAAAQERFEKERDRLSAAEMQARTRELTEMMMQSDQLVMRLSEELEQRKNEIGARVLEDVTAAIKAVADAGKFDLVVQEAAYARAGIDITDQVLKEMARRAGSTP